LINQELLFLFDESEKSKKKINLGIDWTSGPAGLNARRREEESCKMRLGTFTRTMLCLRVIVPLASPYARVRLHRGLGGAI
jgi:hypothetical protein